MYAAVTKWESSTAQTEGLEYSVTTFIALQAECKPDEYCSWEGLRYYIGSHVPATITALHFNDDIVVGSDSGGGLHAWRSEFPDCGFVALCGSEMFIHSGA